LVAERVVAKDVTAFLNERSGVTNRGITLLLGRVYLKTCEQNQEYNCQEQHLRPTDLFVAARAGQ
jgi:hypothetical protein